MRNKKQIAVIGGGIAGLTFSLCLPDDDFECHIFEKKATFGEVGAAISVFPNALCVMDHLGLLPRVLATSGEMKKVFIKTHTGKILSKSEPTGEYPVICTHRADFHGVLLSHSKARLYSSHALERITPLENGTVELTFENGVSKVFDAVIGADGIHSVVRQFVINDGKPIFRGYNIWRGVCQTSFDIGYGSETFGIGQRVGIVPIKNGVYGWWATLNEAFMKDDQPEGTKQKLHRLFGHWHHPIPELIENTGHILKNSLTDRKPVRGWTKGAVTLLGDAAHPTTPNLGQGGCMAIEGAYILARAIEKYGLSTQAFERYEALQYPRARMIVEESLRMGKMGQISNPVLASLRNWSFQLMPSAIAMKMIDKYFSYRVTQVAI
jgi:2-polyprenyl-6-methoxyphenol hydroxylase-like FAD-dependent oxidoreductase